MNKLVSNGTFVLASIYGVATAFVYAGLFFLVRWVSGGTNMSAALVTGAITVGISVVSLVGMNLVFRMIGISRNEIMGSELYKAVELCLKPLYRIFFLGLLPGILLVGLVWGTEISLIVGALSVGGYFLGMCMRWGRLIYPSSRKGERYVIIL